MPGECSGGHSFYGVIQMTGSTMRSTRALLIIAIATPLALGVLFVPVFRWVQSWHYPTGVLEGVDLTPFADRGELMLRSFAWALFVLVMAVGLLATSWRGRLVILCAGAAAAGVSYVAVFWSLLAG
jgi:hypothetical protein